MRGLHLAPTRGLHLALLALAAVLAATAIFVPDAALAAADGKEIGKNIGSTLSYWGKWIFTGVVAIFASVYLAKRDVGGGAAFVMMVVVLGGLVLYKSGAANLVQAIWKEALG